MERNIYHKVTKDGNGLSVAITRYGLRASEMTPVAGLIENPEGNYLVITGEWSWEAVRNRNRNYSRDDGRGRMAERLVAAAISLLGYWGGEEEFINNKRNFARV